MRSVRLLLAMGLIVVGWLASSASPIAGEEPNSKSGPAFAAPTNEAAKAAEKLSPEDRIRQALQKKIDVDYVNVPLEKVADDLRQRLGVPVVVDHKELAAVGVKSDSRIDFQASNVPARTVIRLMLKSIGVASVISHETLLVTTREAADNTEETRVYDVTDLVTHEARETSENKTEFEPDFDQLIDLITSCVQPQTWGGSGPGPISPLELRNAGIIVFSQSPKVHEDTFNLLSQLRQVRHEPIADCKEVSRPPKTSDGAAQEKSHMPRERILTPRLPSKAIWEALSKPSDLNYSGVPIAMVAKDLQQRLGVPMLLDVASMKDVGATPATPVTFSLAGVSARSAVYWMLRSIGLSASVTDDAIVITSKENAKYLLVARVYDVWDLVTRRNADGGEGADFAQLVNAVTSCVTPQTWDSVGGPGSIAPFEARGIRALVANQTAEVHQDIEVFLTKVRASRKHGANKSRLESRFNKK